MSEEDDTVRIDVASLVDPDPDVTAYVERYRPPVPPFLSTPCTERRHRDCLLPTVCICTCHH